MIAARVRPQVLILVDKKSFHWKLNPVTPQPPTHVPYENYSVSTATTVLLQGIIVSPGITIVDLYWYYSIIMLYYSWFIVIIIGTNQLYRSHRSRNRIFTPTYSNTVGTTLQKFTRQRKRFLANILHPALETIVWKCYSFCFLFTQFPRYVD